jgi:flagellar L-ring protein precursor FlgH
MKNLTIIITSLFAIIFSGCISEKLDPKINFTHVPIKQQAIKSQPRIIRANTNGSLFNQDNDLYSSNSKTLDRGDIILINIVENLKADSKGERKTNKTNNTDLGGGLISPSDTTFTPYSGVQRLTDKINSGINLGFKTKSANSFTGKTSAKYDEKFTATISAIIQERYQNGNYLIYGEKEILIDGQLQLIRISGIVRPYDIKLPENSVESSKLANAKIVYKKQGIEHDSIVKPWGSSIIENVWPF